MERDNQKIIEWFKELQDNICQGLEQLDGQGKFHEDVWNRPEGGGGRSRAISGGTLIEKGGVNFSEVHGSLSEKISQALSLPDSTFLASGVSIVLHPANPWVPIIHMNVRYFETLSSSGKSTYWFGGGIDLTPHYVNAQSGKFIHQTLKQVCDQADSSYYSRFKKWADDYFFIKHRDETRGVGGIFYDRLNEHSEPLSFAQLWDFHQSVGKSFLPIYSHYANAYREDSYTDREKQWQHFRRGRYVEFNLVWDKGTRFGLDTNGRTESILMSMPPIAQWEYNHEPVVGSKEEETCKWLKKDIDWLSV